MRQVVDRMPLPALHSREEMGVRAAPRVMKPRACHRLLRETL